MTTAADNGPPVGRDEEAAQWCMRLADDRLSAEEKAAFDRWIDTMKNRTAFEDAVVVWRGIDALAGTPELIHARAQALELLREANSKRWARRVSAPWRRPLAVAAAVSVLAVCAFLLLRDRPQVYATALGERRVVQLDDGSRLSMDAASRVEVRLKNDRRELRLMDGRARFDVAKDPLRPFSVAVDSKVVVATGTSFSVERLQENMRVVLFEGRVEVLEQASAAKPGPPQAGAASGTLLQSLSPGRELIASLKRSTGAIVQPVNLSRSASWEAGQLNFVNEPLRAAVERVNRYAKEKLVLGDDTIAAFGVNGVFAAGDTAAFLEAVATYFPVDVVRERGDRFVLKASVEKNKLKAAVPPEN